MPEGFDLAAVVFALSLVAAFTFAWIGRRVSARDTGDRDLAGRGLILLSFVLAGNVFSIATGAFSKMGAAIAAPVAIKVFGWRHDATSLTLAVLAGLPAAYVWEGLGFATVLNEAGVGMVVGFPGNRMYCSLRQYRG